MGVKFLDSDENSFVSDVKLALGQVNQTFFVVYTDEETVDFHKEMPITAFMCVGSETRPYCTGVEEMLDVCMGVSEMPSV